MTHIYSLIVDVTVITIIRPSSSNQGFTTKQYVRDHHKL